MNTVLDSLQQEELKKWPKVMAEPHRFGGPEFRLNK